MKRSHRIGATATATASLLVGAAVTLAAMPHPASARSSAVKPAPRLTPSPDVDALTGSTQRLQAEADALAAELQTQAALKRARAEAPTTAPEVEATTTAPQAQATTAAPRVDTTTGASASTGGEDDDEGGEDD
jgi:hypothetical protein